MAAPVTLSDAAMNFVRDPDGRVRVEDYVSALAAATGEGVLLDAGDFKLADVSGASGSRLIPGQMVLSTRVNELLIGDEAEWDAVPAGAVLAVLRRHLDRLGYPIDRLAAPAPAAGGLHVAAGRRRIVRGRGGGRLEPRPDRRRGARNGDGAGSRGDRSGGRSDAGL